MLRWRFKRDLALGLGFLCLSAVASGSNSVVAIDGDVEVEVGIMPVLTITTPTRVRIVLEPNGPASIADMPVYIATNNQSGLHAAISLDKVSDGVNDTFLRSLVNEYDSNYVLEPLEESVTNMDDFPFDHWGCTFEDDMRYEGLNTSDKPTIKYLTHNPSANEKRHFLCAARASKFQVAGLYSNTIMMTAVPNVLPDTITSITYMQEINETVIASMETDQSYQLVDGRDKKIYWVTKLQDGRVWMTQNLDYDLEAKTDGSELAEWNSLYPENQDSDIVADASKLYKDGGNLVYDTDTDSYVDSSILAFNSDRLHYHIGSFYNIEASARENENGETVVYADASGICPFSWTIPNSQSSMAMYSSDIIANVLSLYGSSAASSLFLAPMGYIGSDGLLSGVGTSGYYLSNGRVSTGAFGNYYDSRNVLAVNGSYGVSSTAIPDTQGGFVRCVAVPGRHYLVVYKNASNSVTLDGGVKPDFEQATLPSEVSVVTYDTKYSLNVNGVEPSNIPSGYTFLGWTTDEFTRTKANVSGVVNLGTTQEVIRASDDGSNEVEISLYPAWEYNYNEPVLTVDHDDSETRTIDDITYMQEITPEIVSNTPYNEIKQLVDTRDNKKYWVRKLGDGNLWMEQNLDLSFDESRTLTPEDTNISSEVTLSNSDELVRQEHSSEGDGLSGSEVSLLVEDSTMWRRVYGSTYNRYTLLGGSTTISEDTGDFAESICPKGWKLPSAKGISDVFYRDNYNETAEYTFSTKDLATSTDVNESSESTPSYYTSHTQNLDDTGKKLSNYGDYWGNANIRGTGRISSSSDAHVITVPGASELYVDIYYAGESTSWDWATVWGGSYSSYNAESYYSSGNVLASKLGGGQSGTYTVNGNTLSGVGYMRLTVPGNTVTFSFRSDGSGVGNGFGYYAVITSNLDAGSDDGGDPLITFKSFNQGTYNHQSSALRARCVASGEKDAGKTLRHISTMQEMKPSICAATPVGTEVQLRDTRDDQTYFVRKMSDGKCWMVQNLAFGKVRNASTLDALSSDMLDRMNYAFSTTQLATNSSQHQNAIGISDDVVTIEYGYPIAKIDDIPAKSRFRKFYSGVYYSYSAVGLGADGLISSCPRGWRLPTSSDAVIPDESFAREELGKIYAEGSTVDYGGTVYLTSTADPDNNQITLSDGSIINYENRNFYPVRCLAR